MPHHVSGWVALALLLGVACPLSVHAQACEPAGGDIQVAQRLFVEGANAIDAGRWSDAIENFERAYTLTCAPSALYNLGVALRALGRHREARDAFDRLIRDHPQLEGEARENAETYQREEAARVATLELAGIDPRTRADLSLDGVVVEDDGARPVRMETDAGQHSIVARIPDHLPFLWEGALSDGQLLRVDVLFEAIPTPETSGGDEGWIALPIVVGALLIGGGIALGVVLQDEAQLRPLFPERTVVLE